MKKDTPNKTEKKNSHLCLHIICAIYNLLVFDSVNVSVSTSASASAIQLQELIILIGIFLKNNSMDFAIQIVSLLVIFLCGNFPFTI